MVDMTTGGNASTEERIVLPWYRNPFGQLMIAAPILAILAAIAMTWYMDYKRENCDRAAQADLSKVAAALERLQDECQDANIPWSPEKLTAEHLKYLIGPYYGWGGTNSKCGVLVRMDGTEVHSCAVLGSLPDNKPSHRNIYRLSLKQLRGPGGGELSPISGACKGRQYGTAPYQKYYNTSSMIDKNSESFFVEPLGRIPKDKGSSQIGGTK